jgi:hypothetical protein
MEEQQLELPETTLKYACNDNKVNLSDILTLIHGQNVGTRFSAQGTPDVECIMHNYSDTMLFVNKIQGGGWTIYSSDTRVPAIVAQSDSGSFDELMKVEGAKLWIQSIAEDMAIIKNLPDEKLNFTEREIACNKAFWESISHPDEYVKENLLQGTRAVIKDSILITGHYEFRYSTSYSEVYDSISRMTDTNWKQGSPYNLYCPLKSTGNGEHAPAGCVAIAGAQMLYFLHEHYEVPATAPSEAYCNGDINSYTWDQTNYTSDIWDYMNTNGSYAAPFIANVGRRLNMDYGDSGSQAYTSDLVNNVFLPYGISCTYANYDTTILKNSLIKDMPVLLDARSTYTSSTGTEKVGHAFIADRYKRTRIVTKNYYEWVYDSYPPYTPIPMVSEKIEYVYSSPNITMIGFNWGWGESYNNTKEWFSLTGDWICGGETSYNWNINRHMIYNFQVIND